MPSERIQRQIDGLLDEAEAAIKRSEWALVRDRAQNVLRLDPENPDAVAYLAAAERDLEVATAAPSTPQTPLASQTPASEPAPAHPTSFANGRYVVKRFLGEGGKKKVYLAHDTLLDRDVAFALIKTEGLDDTGRQRVRREAQAMGRLGSHPNIVSVFDLGEEDGQPYMVTEFMAGGDVEGLIEKAPDHKLSLEQTIEIAKQASRGLEFAHSKGLIHRDLKPGNVWLNEHGVAKIGDFGLSVAVDRSRLTQAGMMVGTVSYMPPESALGGGGQPEAPSDLYSLGAMLYEMIAGRPPFVGDDSIAIISQHINTPPVAPSWHNARCPRALEELVLKLLLKRPEERPQSATDVLNVLNSIDLTVGAYSDTPSQSEHANPLDRLARGVFVGRAQEMAAGRSLVEDAFSGRVSFLIISGELGIGKTRLAEELSTYASLRGATVLWGASYRDQGAPPYWPWVQALRGYVRAREPDRLRSELGSAGPEVAKVVSELRERLPDLPPPTPGDPAQKRFRLFDAIATFLRNAGASQPLVVVLDNLHFADQPTLLLAQFLLQADLSARLLIIGTYREIETGRHDPIAEVLGELAQERRFRRAPLRGLSREETGRLLEALTGHTPSSTLIDRVYDTTEGVPLFVEEIVSLLAEEGKLEAPPSALAIPQSVRQVIGQRLNRLSEEAIETLTLAGLLGREFDLAALRELTGKSEGDLLDLLEGATTSRIIEQAPGTTGRFQFLHGLSRQVLTADLPIARLVRLHGRVGEALERVYGNQAERHAAELAFHFMQAAALSDAQEKAVRYSVLAARSAEAGHAYEEAINHYQDANNLMIEVGQDLGQDRVGVLRGLATAQRFANLIPQAFRNFRAAWRLAQQRGDRQLVAELALEQVRTGFVPPDLQVRTLTEGLEAVPDPESELAAMMHAWISRALRGNRPDESEEHKNRARDLAARYNYPEVELWLAAVDLGPAFVALDLDRVQELEQRLEELERQLGRTQVEGIGYGRFWPLILGDVAQASQRAERLLAVARRARDTGNIWNIIRVPSTAHYLLGEFSEISRVLELDKPQEPDEHKEMARAVLAEVRGDLEGARAGVEAAITASTRLRLPRAVIRWTVALAGIERRRGDRERAEALYLEAARQWAAVVEQWDPLSQRVAVTAELAVEAASWGDTSALARCRAVLGPYEGLVTVWLNSPKSIVVGRALGVIAAAEGRWEEAVGCLERAVKFCEEKGLVVELAHCRMALADALMRRNPMTGQPVETAPSPQPSPTGRGRLSPRPVGEGQGEGPRAADRQRAVALYDQALADYQRLGMPLYVQDVLSRREILKA